MPWMKEDGGGGGSLGCWPTSTSAWRMVCICVARLSTLRLRVNFLVREQGCFEAQFGVAGFCYLQELPCMHGLVGRVFGINDNSSSSLFSSMCFPLRRGRRPSVSRRGGGGG